MAKKVIFEKTHYKWGAGRYRVETREVDGYWSSSWSTDKYFDKKASAISRAESILGKRGIDEVRVIDTEAEED